MNLCVVHEAHLKLFIFQDQKLSQLFIFVIAKPIENFLVVDNKILKRIKVMIFFFLK